jgi:hypothetical protein
MKPDQANESLAMHEETIFHFSFHIFHLSLVDST